jgi:hypothetical protein
MWSRRFVLLAGILVTLNLVLWFAAPGLALRKAIISELFGPKMVRAWVVVKGGAEWHLDRGVITQVNSTQLTLKESDTHVQVIPLSSSTKVFSRLGRRMSLNALALRWRVLVTWPDGGGAAQSVDVEKIRRGHHKGKGKGLG